jgi:hypothetical protein
MIIRDTVLKKDVDVDKEGLIQLIKDGRQVEFEFSEVQDDGVGYITWDTEYWSALDDNKFICTYSLNGVHSKEYVRYNSSDLEFYFKPETAKEVRIS